MGAVIAALHKAAAQEDLTEADAGAALEAILSGDEDPAPIAALLTALHMKGETVDEIVGFARAMRAHAAKVEPRKVPSDKLVDTCGTGGGGPNTFNISTVAAFVVAGAGVPVAKHGNRSITGKCGSADVLEAAGANVQLTPEQAAEAIDEIGLGFLFAPLIHPAMRHVQPVRRALKLRTIFNLLGPLTNPAGAGAQVVGVADGSRLTAVAQALGRLGVRRAFAVHGEDGLDEITTTGPTRVAEVQDGSVQEYEIRPEDFGLPRATHAELQGGEREECALILQRILDGGHGPPRDIVLANAAAALVAAGAAPDFKEGVERAATAVDSGAARQKLEQTVKFTNRFRAE